MEEIKEIAEGNHDDGGDGAADNVEQSQKVGLSEMPVEILEHILAHLDDESLLRASHVCTMFASVAGTAFAQKYSNEYFAAHGLTSRNTSFCGVMLSKYGDKIRELYIMANEENERLLDLAERACCNLNSINLCFSPKIMLPSGLKEARLAYVANLNRASFTEFINRNQQLEIFRLEGRNVDFLDVLDGCSNLKTLEYACGSSFANDLPTIRLIALKTLELRLSDTDNYVRVLRAITCDDLRSFSLNGGFIDVPDSIIDQICSFRTLVSLRLGMYKVSENQLKTLAQRLPHLTEFEMGMVKNVEHTIQLALRYLPKLTKLKIELDDAGDYRELSNDLEKSMQDFHARFVVANTEIKLVYRERAISISKDRIFVQGNVSVEMLWMENLNEKNMRKVLNRLPKMYLMHHVKIINDCADATLDVSKLMHECFYAVQSIEIKSEGPLTVNANATRSPTFFPHLNVLKIQLENHSVVDFLQNLDEEFCEQIEELSFDTKNVQNDDDQELVDFLQNLDEEFCEQIEELSFDTKNVQNDDDQELEHGNDITHLLAKFENLASLHVTVFSTTAINFDANLLLLMCPNLDDLRVHVQRRIKKAEGAAQQITKLC